MAAADALLRRFEELTMKSGRDHIEGLRDGREIYINGER